MIIFKNSQFFIIVKILQFYFPMTIYPVPLPGGAATLSLITLLRQKFVENYNVYEGDISQTGRPSTKRETSNLSARRELFHCLSLYQKKNHFVDLIFNRQLLYLFTTLCRSFESLLIQYCDFPCTMHVLSHPIWLLRVLRWISTI